MTKDEAEAFESLPAFAAILAMRDWDDKAKVITIHLFQKYTVLY